MDKTVSQVLDDINLAARSDFVEVGSRLSVPLALSDVVIDRILLYLPTIKDPAIAPAFTVMVEINGSRVPLEDLARMFVMGTIERAAPHDGYHLHGSEGE